MTYEETRPSEMSPSDPGYADWSEQEIERDRYEEGIRKTDKYLPGGEPSKLEELRRSRLWMALPAGYRSWTRAACPECGGVHKSRTHFIYFGEDCEHLGRWEYPNGAPDIGSDYGRRCAMRGDSWISGLDYSEIDERLRLGKLVEILCSCGNCGEDWIETLTSSEWIC